MYVVCFARSSLLYLHLLNTDSFAKHTLLFGSAEQTPHDVTSHVLCLYSPKDSLLDNLRIYGAINPAGRVFQIVLERHDQHTSFVLPTSGEDESEPVQY